MEQQRLAEQERKMAEEMKRREEAEVKAEIKALKDTINKMSTKAKIKGNVAQVFNLFDRDKNSQLSRDELINILKHAGVTNVNDKEIDTVYKLLDVSGNGFIQKGEFIAVIEGQKQPDYEKHVRDRRKKAKEEEERNQKIMSAKLQAQLKTDYASVDSLSNAVRRDLQIGNVDGLSDIVQGEKQRSSKQPAKLADSEEDILRCAIEI